MQSSLKWIFVLIAVAGLHCAPSDRGAPKKPEVGKVEPDLSTAPDPVKARIEAALNHIRALKLDTTFGFWTVFHGILGLGPDHLMLFDPETKKDINAFDHICNGGKMRGLRFLLTPHGVDVQLAKANSDIEIFVGQGHQDQFVAEMIQWGVPPDRKFKIEGREYPFQAFIDHSKMRASVKEKQELAWAVLVVAEHFGTEHAWTNAAGEKITVEDMLRYELALPMEVAACGGTHRLFGLTWVLYRHRERGKKTGGVFQEVIAALEAHKNHAKKHRNADFSFSTEYFKGPGAAADSQLRIGTTGHILEWLALYLPDRELKEPWMQEAAGTLAKMILETGTLSIEGGALYHAAHGLNLYYDRVYGDPKAKRPYPRP